jgi:Chaperone of endosialidase
MTSRPITLVAALVVLSGAAAQAQPLGTFRWQVQPYCNVLTVSVTQDGAIYTLDGTDDQCGAGTQAAVVGTAFPNPNGTIGLGFNVVSTPGGAPAHIDATITLPSASGTWRDGAGNTGTFTLTPGAGTGGSPRPIGGLGLGTIDTSEIQSRVVGTCPSGQAMQGINQDGTVACGTAGGAGTITGVTAGAGLTGGGVAGVVPLSVQFSGDGAATTVARADHNHSASITGNTAVGDGALDSAQFFPSAALRNTAVGVNALTAVTTQDDNTGIGHAALAANIGAFNTAVGAFALDANTNGTANTAVGYNALSANTATSNNTAVGAGSLDSASSGSSNTAIGTQTLLNLTIGDGNIALGYQAGTNVTTGNRNIYIENSGVAAEDDTTRIGVGQVAAYISGIYGRTVNAATDQTVFIDSTGKLGTIVSSGRFKDDIQPIADELTPLQRLRAVSYRYKPELGRGSTRQYGLIAEEVAEVMPELAVVDDDGTVQSVRYHVLTPLLLAEVQRLERERAALAARLDALERQVNSGPPRQ